MPWGETTESLAINSKVSCFKVKERGGAVGPRLIGNYLLLFMVLVTRRAPVVSALVSLGSFAVHVTVVVAHNRANV